MWWKEVLFTEDGIPYISWYQPNFRYSDWVDDGLAIQEKGMRIAKQYKDHNVINFNDAKERLRNEKD